MQSSTAVLLQGVTKRFGDFVAVKSIELAIADGEFFSLLGPSGCGKTTTLRMIAGFEQPSAGQIFIMGQPVAGIPAYRRPVNTVFQSYALFPHMTVRENVAFGLQMSRVPNNKIAPRVQQALERVHMLDFGERKPAQLSGGQRQRVALARALVNRPKVLLLDEPLGALDLKLRKAMQFELKEIQRDVGITFVYVTHDQEEALTMSDRIAVMDGGVVQQVGAPRAIYENPANRFVADFIGETNFIEGVVSHQDRLTTILAGGIALRGDAGDQAVAPDQKVTLAIRPEKVMLLPAQNGSRPAFSDEQVAVDGRVAEVVYIGTDTRYRVTLGDDINLVVRVQNSADGSIPAVAAGDAVHLVWRGANARVLTA